MARVVSNAPDHLTMNLFAPGMSLLHRAGLGGLACTLKVMERQYEAGLLPKNKLPAPYQGDTPPWEIDEQTVTLRFGKPENAGKYLERLFAFGFSIRSDGLIFMPGQFHEKPATAVLADLQAGILLTFLQHGRVRKLETEPTTVSYEPEGDGIPGVAVSYKRCSSYKHQASWKEFVNRRGCLKTDTIGIDGPISPGSVVRHVAYGAKTAIEDPPERMLPLIFAMVGCLALPTNRGVAVLLVPETENLLEFIHDRPAMTPTTAKECRIASAADAALQSQCRLREHPVREAMLKSRARSLTAGSSLPGVYAMTFTSTAWATQQKTRVATIYVPPGDEQRLDRFERALALLPTRIVCRTVTVSNGRGRSPTSTEHRESFRADSVIRPLVAENLALGRKWYSGFSLLMTKTNPATDKPFRNQVQFERKGLHDMIKDDKMWDEAGERTLVQAVHDALRGRYGMIADENKNNQAAMKNRFSGEYDKWRLAFAGAKTANQFRTALCDLFSRAGRNRVLQQSWNQVLPMLRPENWQHCRDLALLALCSYQGKNTETGADID